MYSTELLTVATNGSPKVPFFKIGVKACVMCNRKNVKKIHKLTQHAIV